MRNKLCLGAHLSIAGGLENTVKEAKRLGLCTLQFFSRNPRSLRNPKRPRIIDIPFKPFFLHAPYLLNLASPDAELYTVTKEALKEDLTWAESLGAEGIIVHPGSHKGSGVGSGLERITNAIYEILKETNTKCKIVLENTAGSGTELGVTPEEISEIFSGVDFFREKLGLCLDTCHLFAGGFDIRTKEEIKRTFDRWFSIIDRSYLMCFHANDSKGKLGSHLDRHIHIGEGNIGEEGFRNLLSFEIFRESLLIIETPKEPGADEKNLEKLRNLVEN
ncbi:MAG: deoxyribonuclease IV [bacterium]